jgi:hypothetical protein
VEAVALSFILFDPGGFAFFSYLFFRRVIMLRVLFVVWSAVCYILSHTRRKRRRRPNLSNNQRVRRLSSCVRPATEGETRQIQIQNKSCVVVYRYRRSRRRRGPSLNIRRRLENIQLMDRPEQRRWNSHRFRFNPTSLSAFVNEIDPLEHYRQLRYGSDFSLYEKSQRLWTVNVSCI